MAADDGRATVIGRKTQESAAMVAELRRAATITAAINQLTFNEADEVRALFTELIA